MKISRIILDRDAADLSGEHAAVGGEEGIGDVDLDDLAVGDHAGIHADVGDEQRRVQPGAFEDPLGALGDFPAAGGDGMRFLTDSAEQRGITDGGANGVGVRVLVADDVEGGHVGWDCERVSRRLSHSFRDVDA